MLFKDEVNCKDVDFATPISQISKVEKQNELAIKVFGYEDNIHPLYLTKDYSKDPINLLFITDEQKSHYYYIKDFNKLCFGQTKTKIRNTLV